MQILLIAVAIAAFSSNCEKVFQIKKDRCNVSRTLNLLVTCMGRKTPLQLARNCVLEFQGHGYEDEEQILLNVETATTKKLIKDAENIALSNVPLEIPKETENDLCDKKSDLFERIEEDIKRQEFEEAQRTDDNEIDRKPAKLSLIDRIIHNGLRLYLAGVIIAYSALGFGAVHQYVKHVDLNMYFVDVACLAAASFLLVSKGILNSDAYRRLSSRRKTNNTKSNDFFVQIEEEKK